MNGREGWGDDPNSGWSATPTVLITSRPSATRPIFLSLSTQTKVTHFRSQFWLEILPSSNLCSRFNSPPMVQISTTSIFVCAEYKNRTKDAFLWKKSRPEFLIAATMCHKPILPFVPSPASTSTALGRKNRMVWVQEFLTHAPPLIAGTNAGKQGARIAARRALFSSLPALLCLQTASVYTSN